MPVYSDLKAPEFLVGDVVTVASSAHEYCGKSGAIVSAKQDQNNGEWTYTVRLEFDPETDCGWEDFSFDEWELSNWR